MDRISSTVFAFVLLFPSIAKAQTQCGIGGMRLIGEHVELSFKSDQALRVVSNGAEGRKEFSVQRGTLVGAGGKVQSFLSTDKESMIFVHEKMNRTCILRMEERDKTRGLYVEEIELIGGQPPRLITEFVELK